MNTNDPPKTAGEMLADVMGNVGNLVRNELDLARTEFAASLKSAGTAIAAILVAAILALIGLNVLAAALIGTLVWAGMAPQWASLLVGGGLLVIALLIGSSALSSLQQIGFVPKRTARNVKRDAEAVKDACK